MSCCHGNPPVKKGLRLLAGILAVAALFAVVTGAGAETCKLELKKIDPSDRERTPLERMIRYSYPQRFFMQIGGPKGMFTDILGPDGQDRGKPKFSEIIKKEPAYVAEHPFRAVVKLGSHYYGFAFDAAEPKKAEENESEKKKEATPEADSKKKVELKAVAYSRLYFDLNRNGDLTDDEAVEAESTDGNSANYAQTSFPRVDLTIEIDGTKTDYAFATRVYAQFRKEYAYAFAQLSAAAYREGEITLDGTKKRVVIVDFNSNGVFNDASGISDADPSADGTVYPILGDHLFVIDPDADIRRVNPFILSASDCLHFVDRLISLRGRLYDLNVTASGDELTFSPAAVPAGYVTNPNRGYRAVLYGENGFLKVVGDEDGRASVPEGEWKLFCCTIDRNGWNKPEEAKTAKEPESPSGGSAESSASETANADDRKRSGPTFVSALAKKGYKPVKVTKDKTVELPFGPPYRPLVSVEDKDPGTRKARLRLSVVGVGDELCSDLEINGRRPEKPKFTITTKDGKEVESDAFEYG